MALFMKAEDALLASINAKNSISIKPDQLIWGPGQNVNDVSPKPNTTKNSSVLLRSNTPRTIPARFVLTTIVWTLAPCSPLPH